MENSCYFCGFCETEICGVLEGLLYLASLNRSMRYLIACLSCCNKKYCLLLQFLPNWRLSRGSSLPSFFIIVYFAKVVVLGFQFSISVTKFS